MQRPGNFPAVEAAKPHIPSYMNLFLWRLHLCTPKVPRRAQMCSEDLQLLTDTSTLKALHRLRDTSASPSTFLLPVPRDSAASSCSPK